MTASNMLHYLRGTRCGDARKKRVAAWRRAARAASEISASADAGVRA